MATFLITWFHFKWTVPEIFSNLFVGGAIGNTLFFYTSGYLLHFRGEKFRGEWLLKKYIRIMPSIWVFTLFSEGNLGKWYNLIYPTNFWFVNVILCYFAIVYLVLFVRIPAFSRLNCAFFNNLGGGKYLISLMFLACVTQIIWFYIFIYPCEKIVMDEGGFKCFFFFFFFLWGYWDRQKTSIWRGSGYSALLLPIAIIVFFAYKKWALTYMFLLSLQVFLVPVFLFLVLLSARKFVGYLNGLSFPDWVKKLCIVISNLTLDIYIVQIALIDFIMPLFPYFPCNVVLTFVAICVAAFFNNRIAAWISDKLNNYL